MHHVSKRADIIRAEETEVKGVHNTLFRHGDWSVLRVDFSYMLEDLGEAGPKLDYHWFSRLVCRLVDRWGGWV